MTGEDGEGGEKIDLKTCLAGELYPDCFLSTLQNMVVEFQHAAENFHQGEFFFVQAANNFFHAS